MIRDEVLAEMSYPAGHDAEAEKECHVKRSRLKQSISIRIGLRHWLSYKKRIFYRNAASRLKALLVVSSEFAKDARPKDALHYHPGNQAFHLAIVLGYTPIGSVIFILILVRPESLQIQA